MSRNSNKGPRYVNEDSIRVVRQFAVAALPAPLLSGVNERRNRIRRRS
jgi:hypothetical protein